jgi:hypothetical protein
MSSAPSAAPSWQQQQPYNPPMAGGSQYQLYNPPMLGGAQSYNQYGSPMSGAGPYNQYGSTMGPAAGAKGQATTQAPNYNSGLQFTQPPQNTYQQPYQQQQSYQPQNTYNPMVGNTGMMGGNSFINPQYQQPQPQYQQPQYQQDMYSPMGGNSYNGQVDPGYMMQPPAAGGKGAMTHLQTNPVNMQTFTGNGRSQQFDAANPNNPINMLQ